MKIGRFTRRAVIAAALPAALVANLGTLGAQTVQTAADDARPVVCRLEIYDVESGTRTVLKEYRRHIEAPNWTVDGAALIYNSGGKLFRVEIADPASDVLIPAGDTRANNDHVLSADGQRIAISAGTPEVGASRIFTLPLTGGEPRLVTPNAPSYLHGWSPDGTTLAYCAERGGNFDVYTIPAEGGPERRLTTAEGLDDGPEYSPDGRHIWFNSVRTGLMQVWRMRADGTEQTQISFDEGRNSWFPHVSPDGRWVVYIAYKKGDVAPGDHPAGRNVELRLLRLGGGDGSANGGANGSADVFVNSSGRVAADGSGAETVVSLFGGQGTINVNSWSPDSRRFAFVSYVKN